MGFVVDKVALEQIIFQPMVVIYLPSGAQFFPTAVAGNVLIRAMADLLSWNEELCCTPVTVLVYNLKRKLV